MSQALSGTLNLKSALHRVLEILARHHGAIRSIVNHTTASVMTVVQTQCLSRNRRTVGAAMINPRMAAIM